MSVEKLVFGYDGSDDARHAVSVGARMLGARSALVITVWDLLLPGAATAPPAGGSALRVEPDQRDPERVALHTARAGADLARDAGLAPEFDARQGSGVTGIARALLDAADSWNADIVVVGRRDMSRLREVVLGSVSDAVVRDAVRPVLVVPAAGG